MWAVLLLAVVISSISPSQGLYQVTSKENYTSYGNTENKNLSNSSFDEILDKCRKENPSSSRRTLTLCLRSHGVTAWEERRERRAVEKNGKAKCGKRYKLKRGAKRTFQVKGNENFCKVFFKPRGKAELQLVCRKFDLSNCDEEYLEVTDQDSKEKYCNNEGPDRRKGLRKVRLTYKKVSKVSDKPNILCVVKGVKASGGGGSSGVTQAPGCDQVCGKAPSSAGAPRIVGGQASQPGEYPWMVRLTIIAGASSILCGGSIITSLHIITAAHCFDLNSTLEVTVVAGDHNIETEDESNTQVIGAKKITVHPKFNATTLANDIVVITLQSPLEWTDNVGPICLPPDKTFVGSEAVITGWGLLDYQEMTSPDELQEAGVTVVDQGECNSAYIDPVTDKQICAADPGQIACSGDSGGPLVTKENGIWLLLGVTSFVPRNCTIVAPVVFARVSAYSKWILNEVSSGSC